MLCSRHPVALATPSPPPALEPNLFEVFDIPGDFGVAERKVTLAEKPGAALGFEPPCLGLAGGSYDLLVSKRAQHHQGGGELLGHSVKGWARLLM